MRRRYSRLSFPPLLLFILLGLNCALGQTNCAPLSAWQRSYGGTSRETAAKIQPTADGGYILGASSASAPSGNKTAPSYGEADFWLLKLNATGDIEWEKAYGGSEDDSLQDLIRTPDGGYILVGSSYSGPSGNKTSPARGQLTDGWVVRVDANGEKLWDRSYGGSFQDAFTAIRPLAGGDYILAGYSSSLAGGTKTSTNYGRTDLWAVRIDSTGQQIWDASYGASEADNGSSVVVMPDGNILLGGTSSQGQGGNKTAASYGESDYWLVMIDPAGTLLWDRSYGGIGADHLDQLLAAPDGTLVLAGSSTSYATGNKLSDGFGEYDVWILRLASDGGTLWDKTMGGIHYDTFGGIASLPDGGWIVAASSNSGTSPTKTSRNHGADDAWIIRLAPDGQKIWDQSFGGTTSDGLNSSVAVSTAGHIVIATTSYSAASGNKTSPLYGDSDLWLVELAPESDCDLDGVPNESDACPETPLATTVNRSGCSLEQLCPCSALYEGKDAYVACVSNSVTSFVADGLITPAEGTNLITAAVNSPCPMIPNARIFFGLTNALLGDARFGDNSSSFVGPVEVLTPNDSGADGLAVYLGQAESGIFIRPDAPIWGNFDENWRMTEKAYGSRDGVLHSLLATIQARKPYYEVYPVTIDFSPLGAQSLTFEVYSMSNLVSSVTTPGPTGTITFNSGITLGPRVNPIWRWPDGSVGALIEFLAADPAGSATFEIGDSGAVNAGRQVFVRANNLTSRVDYVSRAEIFAAGGLSSFSFQDEQLGIFHRPHKAVGPTVLHAHPSLLNVRALDAANESGAADFGALIELNVDDVFDVSLEPLAFTAPSAFTFFLNGRMGEEDPETFGLVRLRNQEGSLQLLADFSVFFGGSVTTTEPDIGYELKVYDHGRLTGTALSSNGAPAGTITSAESNATPALQMVGGRIRIANHQPEFALTFTQRVVFTDLHGISSTGNQFRVTTVAPLRAVTALSAASLVASGLGSFSIVGELTSLEGPALKIARHGTDITLSWALRNQLYELEASGELLGTYEPVLTEATLVDNVYHVTLAVAPNSNRFFRLRLRAE